MSLEAALLTARSGLLYVQRALASTSHDIAAADVVGHTDKTVTAVTLTAAGLAFGVRALDAQREVDAALVAALNAQRAALAAARVREALLGGIELAHGRAEAGESIGDLMGVLRDAFLGLRAEPADSGRQAAVLLAAEDIAGRFNEVARAIGAARQRAQEGIVTEVARLNAGLREVASLTRDIQAEIARGGSAAALQDRRDAAIARLSESLELRAVARPDGGMTLIARGGMVLPLDPDRDAFTTADAQLGPGASWAGGTVPGVALGGVDVTAQLRGGRLAEYVALRDATLPRYQAELDIAAAQLAARLDAQGLRLFTSAAGAVPDPSQPYAGSSQVGFAAAIRVNPAVRAAPSLLRDGTHAVTGAPGGPSAFTPNPPGGPAGFVALLDRVLDFSFGAEAAAGASWPAIATTGLGPDGTLASPFAAPPTLTGYVMAVTAAHTGDRAAATAAREAAEGLTAGLEARFAARSGVDVDGEMAAMVQLQNAYAANAKVIEVVQRMWDQLFAALR
jgi:flagellar hook-associated protein 1 FlgK